MRTLHKLCGLGLLCLSLLSGCNSQNNEVSSGKEEVSSGPIDNSERAKNHDKLYIWRSNYYVANSGEVSPHDYIFLTPYLASNPTGGAVIVCPGGAYTHVSNSTNDGWQQKCTNNLGEQREASDIAYYYNAQGISVFVLNYRTKGLYSETTNKKITGEFGYKQLLSDGLRAVKYVRNLAINKYNEYYINKDKIGILGYSAGGNLASEVLTQPDFDYASYDASYRKDAIDNLSAKVNSAVLCYGVLDFTDSVTHKTTRTNFTGGDSSLYNQFNPVKNVTSSTAPCYIWAEEKDASVKYQCSQNFANALTAKGVQNELHIFHDDGYSSYHGIGCAQDYTQAKVWPSQSTSFLKNLGFKKVDE